MMHAARARAGLQHTFHPHPKPDGFSLWLWRTIISLLIIEGGGIFDIDRSLLFFRLDKTPKLNLSPCRLSSIRAEGQDRTCPEEFIVFVTVRGWMEESMLSCSWRTEAQTSGGTLMLKFPFTGNLHRGVGRWRRRPVPLLEAVWARGCQKHS